MTFDSPKMRAFLLLYRLIWTVLLPFGLLYLAYRSRKDHDYIAHLGERFGAVTAAPQPVWIHAVSIGEFRSALPLIDGLLAQGETIHVTCFTPAGRREAMKRLATPMAEGRASVSWVPLELAWAFGRFFRRVQPKYGLVMEIEIWPRMIASARANNVPLLMCNAQYPSRSFERDQEKTKLRGALMTGFSGALVKSELQRDRFAAAGVTNIAVTGELRFDQPLPAPLITAGQTLRAQLAPDRPVICFASVVEGEDPLMITAIQTLLSGDDPRPFIVYVPRAPERFAPVRDELSQNGLSVASRSDVLDSDFALLSAPDNVDILLGDSLGEMYGYLAMADRVVVGGGFNPKGAHNISEALALGKPVWTGPYVWTIEYPAVEAAQAGVLRQTEATGAALARALGPDAPPPASEKAIAAFFAQHSGATARTLAAIPQVLETARRSV